MNPMSNQPHQPVVTTPPPPSGPKRYAQLVGDYVKTAIIVVFWALVLLAALAGAFIGCRAMYWAVTQVLKAMGG